MQYTNIIEFIRLNARRESLYKKAIKAVLTAQTQDKSIKENLTLTKED